MKNYFRLLLTFLLQSLRAPCSIIGPCDTPFRVLPNDLDVLMHMNNGVYLTLMDLGRTDLLLRSGAYKIVRKNGWYPVLAGETIRFRRSLKLWQKYIIRTRVLGWDERSIYLEQQFLCGAELHAQAVVDARFLQVKGGRVSPAELMAELNLDEASPELPAWVQTWVNSNTQMRADSA